MSDTQAPKRRPPLSEEQQRERSRAQVRIIVEALGEENVGVATLDGDDWADFVYLYRKLNILVRDNDVDRVLRALESLGIGAEVSDNLVNGLTRLELAVDATVPDVLDQLDRALGVGVATPDHVLYVTGRVVAARRPSQKSQARLTRFQLSPVTPTTAAACSFPWLTPAGTTPRRPTRSARG